MQPVTDTFLLHVTEIAATLIGLFLVGVLFYVEGRPRSRDFGGPVVAAYMRAGTRIVLVLYAIPLVLPLVLVSLRPAWGAATLALLSVGLLAANVDTARRVGAVGRVTGSTALVANEIVSTLLVVVLVALPWLAGGLHPRREHLVAALLLSLAAGFLSTCALVMSVFDLQGDSSRLPERATDEH